jgi:hypothetical protein
LNPSRDDITARSPAPSLCRAINLSRRHPSLCNEEEIEEKEKKRIERKKEVWRMMHGSTKVEEWKKVKSDLGWPN